MSELGVRRMVRDPRSRRHAQRLTLPLEVVIDGRPFVAADWSAGGFAVVDRTGGWSRGARHAAELRFPTHDSHWGFSTTASVAHVGANGRVGFRFVDLLPGQIAHMRALVAACTSGHVVSLDDFLHAASGNAASPAFDEHPPRQGVGSRLRRLAGYAAVLGLGAGFLMLASLMVHTQFLTVRAVHAATGVPVLRMRAPAAGVLAGAELLPGASAPAGMPLFDLADEALLAEIEIAETELGRRTADLEGLRRRLAATEAFFVLYQTLARAGVARAEAALAQADQGLRLAERERERMIALQSAGYLSQSRLDLTLQRHTVAAQALLTAQADFDQARANLAMSRDGRFFTGSRVEGAEPARLAEDVREAAAAHALQSVKLAALRDRREGLRQASPCDCVVVATLASRGEWIAAGTVVHLLRPRDVQPRLIVKVAQDQAKLLDIGGQAAIRLPDRPGTVAGTVTAVSHLSPAEPRLGLPEEIERDQRFATVIVELPAGVAARLAPGAPAQVIFPIAWKSVAAAWFAW